MPFVTSNCVTAPKPLVRNADAMAAGWHEACSCETCEDAAWLAPPEVLMNLAISRILVPVDFSPHSEEALRYATALADRLGASVDVLHVVEEPVAMLAWSSAIDMPNAPALRDTLVEEATRHLERYQALAASPGVPMLTAVRVGQPVHAITEYVRTTGVDLVVMGTHGRGGHAAAFMGSVAARMVRHAPCPVLTLHSDTLGDWREPTFAAEPALLRHALGRRGASRE